MAEVLYANWYENFCFGIKPSQQEMAKYQAMLMAKNQIRFVSLVEHDDHRQVPFLRCGFQDGRFKSYDAFLRYVVAGFKSTPQKSGVKILWVTNRAYKLYWRPVIRFTSRKRASNALFRASKIQGFHGGDFEKRKENLYELKIEFKEVSFDKVARFIVTL